jgi:hypothetical protein
MKFILLPVLMWASQSFAATNYKLDDPAILGEYALTPANKSAELQSVELIYNPSNELTLNTIDNEYILTGPDKDGVIFEEDGEPNCDGDEGQCWYDVHTVARLGKVKNAAGEEVPQIGLEITRADAFDDSGKSEETLVYVFTWSKTLPYATPYYLETATPADLAKINTDCMATLNRMTMDINSFTNPIDICPNPATYKYRDSIDDAFAYYIKSWYGPKSKDVKLLTPAQAKSKIFAKAKALARVYNGKSGPVDSKMLLDQINTVEAYALKADKIYFIQYLKEANLYLVDLKEQTFTRISMLTTTKYPESK